MDYSTLISAQALSEQINNPDWVIIDCRFSLAEPDRGRRDYEEAHIPGAVYAHLNTDLSGPHIPGQTGRHPLPDIETFSASLSRWGVGPDIQVALYDDGGGAIAARLWWMLRFLGHSPVAVLNGGWQFWIAEKRPTRSGTETYQPRNFTPLPRVQMISVTQEVDQLRATPDGRVFDSRSADRFLGFNETIDPVAGHIPGAISAPYQENIGPDDLFLSKEQLHQRFLTLLDGVPPEQAVFYCGSGVTAAHNLLALAYAGLGDARLYVGSWSEWITDPERPIALG
ncbi:MAG TPA: sulfurtransferase [Patescibacteria group bacterium]|nr:sulfurtransferase [Patescibacteria group bacterium]